MQILSRLRKLFLLSPCCSLRRRIRCRDPADDALQSLVQAEKNFAQMSVEKGNPRLVPRESRR